MSSNNVRRRDPGVRARAGRAAGGVAKMEGEGGREPAEQEGYCTQEERQKGKDTDMYRDREREKKTKEITP